jgi:hypothetical protein
MDDSEQSAMLEALEAALKEALHPVITEIASIRAQIAATNQRNETGAALPELDEISSIRARLASQRNA